MQETFIWSTVCALFLFKLALFGSWWVFNATPQQNNYVFFSFYWLSIWHKWKPTQPPKQSWTTRNGWDTYGLLHCPATLTSLFSLYRGSYAFGGPNLGPCSQQPMIRCDSFHQFLFPLYICLNLHTWDSVSVSWSSCCRPAPGCCLPNVSFSMQQTSTTGVPQAVAYAAPHITEQPLSSVKHSPSQLSQVPLQHMQAPEKCFQSPQQAIFDTHKQTQILEQQQNQQIAQQEVVSYQHLFSSHLSHKSSHFVARRFLTD